MIYTYNSLILNATNCISTYSYTLQKECMLYFFLTCFNIFLRFRCCVKIQQDDSCDRCVARPEFCEDIDLEYFGLCEGGGYCCQVCITNE